MKKTKISLALASLLLGGSCGLLNAEDTVKLDEIKVVSSTLTEQSLKDVPNTMSVVTSEQIEQMGAATMYDVLTKIPGLEQSNQKGAFNIRGMGFGYSVILINGRKPARLESNHDGLGFLLSSIGVSNIERIEVIRGQAGAMYGANALSGVVNIITKKSNKESGAISFSAGNAEAISAVTYDFGRVENFDAIFNVSTTKGMGIKEHSVIPGSTGNWSESDTGVTLNLNLDAGYHINDNHEIRFITGYIDQDKDTASYKQSTNTTTNSVTKRRNFNNVLLYNGLVENHNYTLEANANKSMHDSSTKDYTFTDLNFTARDTWIMNDSNLFTFGVEYSDLTFEHDAAKLGDNLTRESLFLQDEILLFDGTLIVVPSARYDHDSEFGGELIPRLGVTWEFINDQRLKMNYGKAYIAPNLVQLFGVETRGNGSAYGNPDLQPETSLGWELRYEGEFENIKASLGYFQADIEDKIGSEDLGVDLDGDGKNDSLNVNTEGTTDSKGIEASLSVDFLQNFTVTGNYAWLDNENQDGKRLGYYAEHSFGLDLMYTKPEWGFNANLWGKYNLDYTNTTGAEKGDKNTYGDEILYDYGTLNFSMSKKIKDKYSVTTAIYNLVNTSRNTATDGSVDPLEWRISFKVDF